MLLRARYHAVCVSLLVTTAALAAHHGPKLVSTLVGEQVGSGFGVVLAAAGDVNGDGYDDVLVGAPYYASSEISYAGKVYLFLGGPEGLESSPAWTFTGDREHPFVAARGSTLAGVDVNGDGYADIVVGMGASSGGVLQGAVAIFFGSPAGPPAAPSQILLADSPYAGLGSAVAPAGDVDGDGFADLAVNAENLNEVWIYRGSADGVVASPSWVLPGPSPLPYFNTFYGGVLATGDVNGDGFADVCAAAPEATASIGQEGIVLAFPGSAAGPSIDDAWSHDGIQLEENFGTTMGVGDLNGDGFSDLVVSAPWYDVSEHEGDVGQIRVFVGSKAGLGADPSRIITGTAVDNGFGRIFAVDDVDGDGFADVVTIGPPDAIFYGSPDGIGDGIPWDPHAGTEASPILGQMASAGDVNGDSFADILVAGFGFPLNAPDYVYVFAGQPRNRPPDAVCPGPQTWECNGTSRASGALEGDGSHDPDGDPVTYQWTSASCTLDGATVADATGICPLGDSTATLTVTDDSSAKGSCAASIAVRDTQPPVGTVIGPTERACFGPAALPVTVADDFTDVCDPRIQRTYDPAPGPSYATHGDYHVTLTARDRSGNAGTALVDFTIDTIPPTVELLSPADRTLLVPGARPFTVLFRDSDDDGASGGVVHEVVKLQGCTIYDGLTYGNRDGLLSDETLTLTGADLCRVAALCGFTTLSEPEIRVEATDCGGNVGVAAHRFAGSLALRPGICGK